MSAFASVWFRKSNSSSSFGGSSSSSARYTAELNSTRPAVVRCSSPLKRNSIGSWSSTPRISIATSISSAESKRRGCGFSFEASVEESGTFEYVR